MIRVVRREGKRLKTVASEAAVPMPTALRPILREWSLCCDSEWLFPGSTKAGPWTGGRAGKRAGDRLKAEAEAIGIQGLTPHTLRHSLATHLRGYWGLSPKQIQAILRHSNQLTQELYCHQDLQDLTGLVRDVTFEPPRPRQSA